MSEHAADLRRSVFASLMAALMVVGAYIAIPLPISPVPLVLQNLFILLAGLLLGPWWGLASVAVYLLLGAVGLPVFAGGTGGLAHFAGPTGGYLLGYIPAVVVIGLLGSHTATEDSRERAFAMMARDLTALIVGSLVVYTCGVFWLTTGIGMPLSRALAVGVIPFLVGDALKIAAALSVNRFARPLVSKR
jgi:biotin transport system substrate-specific component